MSKKSNTNSRKKSKQINKAKKTTSEQKSVSKNNEKKRRKNDEDLTKLTKEELLEYIRKLKKKYKKEFNRKINEVKKNGRKVATEALIGGSAIGLVAGVVNSNTIAETAGNFVSIARVAEGYNTEGNEHIVGYVTKRNKNDDTITLKVMGANDEIREITLPTGNVEERGLMSLSKLDRITECEYTVPEGANVYLRTGEMKVSGNIAKKLIPGESFPGSKPVYIPKGNGEYQKITYAYYDGEEYCVFMDELEKQEQEAYYDDANVIKVVANKDIDVYANPEKEGRINASVKKGTEISVLKYTWDEPTGGSDVPIVKPIIDKFYPEYVEMVDGRTVIGWINKADLDEKVVDKSDEEYNKAKEIFENTKFSFDGQVLGIDSRDMTADTLRNILTSYTMPSSLEKDGEVYNTSAFEGCNVGFVNIRCGASGYGEAMAPIDPDFIPLCQVCEECNRPYTVYYFSTSCTLDEAIGESKGTENEDKKSERERIRNELEEMKSNNLEPRAIIINKELASENNGGRMQGKDVTEITAALMIWVEKDAKEIFGKNIPVLLYTSDREVNSEEKIIDLPNLKDLLGHKVPVWVPEIPNKNGLINDTGYFRRLEEDGIVDVCMTQFKQDFKMPTEIDNDDVAYDFDSITMSRYADTMLGVPLSDILLPRDESSQEENDKDFIQDILKKIDKRRANLSEPEATEQGDEIGQ